MGEQLSQTYTPRGVLLEAIRCKSPEVLIAGPAGTGKSMAALSKVHGMSLANPGMRALIVRKTLASLGSTALDTFRKRVIKEALAAGKVAFYGGSSEEPPQYRYSNGSAVIIGGIDKPLKIMSSEYDLIFCQESTELTESDWESLTTRLRNHVVASFQQIIGDCNPDAPTHWLKVRCNNGKTTMFESRHEDNPTLFDEDGTMTINGAAYMAKLDALTGVRYYRLRKGIWAAAEGVIYDEFDPAVHLVTLDQVIPNSAELKERLGRELTVKDIPEEWPRYWSVDFGYVNPFVCQMYAETPDGQLAMYREIYRTKRTVDQHAADIMDLVSVPDPNHVSRRGDVASSGRIWTEPRPRAVVCDHDAEGRATLAKELNLPTRAAKKKVKEGIEKVQVRMRLRTDGRPGIVFLRDSVASRDQDLVDAKKPASTVEEFPAYVWNIRDGGKTKDEPVKQDDHGCLIAGTMVETSVGTVPIEHVEAGDLVMTREGLREVIAAGMTSASAQTLRIGIANGTHLIGTGNHPVWVVGQGWTRLGALQYGDILFPCQPPRFGSVASSSAAILSRRTGLSGAISSPVSQTGRTVSSASTRRSGATPTAPFRMAMKSTMRTSSRSTTISATWLVLRSWSTRLCTASAAGSEEGRGAFRRQRGKLLRRGTAAKLAANGMPRIVSSPGSAGRLPSTPASSAARGSNPSRSAVRGSARTTASRHGAGRLAWMTRSASARAVLHRSRSIGTPSSSIAGCRVLSVTAGERVPVFNLTVADQPEYFANGFLVHNCDGARYICEYRDPSSRPGMRVL